MTCQYVPLAWMKDQGHILSLHRTQKIALIYLPPISILRWLRTNQAAKVGPLKGCAQGHKALRTSAHSNWSIIHFSRSKCWGMSSFTKASSFFNQKCLWDDKTSKRSALQKCSISCSGENIYLHCLVRVKRCLHSSICRQRYTRLVQFAQHSLPT